MNKWITARHVALKTGQYTEIAVDEHIALTEFDHPYIHLVIIKESYRRPEELEELEEDD